MTLHGTAVIVYLHTGTPARCWECHRPAVASVDGLHPTRDVCGRHLLPRIRRAATANLNEPVRIETGGLHRD